MTADADARAVAEACAAFRLQRELPRSAMGRGDVLGSGVGSSVEFHDFREYVPGDDPRHVDWAVYGRTQQLVVRLFRAEVNPGLDVVVDGSASMGLADGTKPTLVRQLAGFLLHSGRAQGARAQLWEAGDQVVRHHEAGELVLEGATPALFTRAGALASRLPRGGQRVVISDFMSAESVPAMLGRFAQGAAQLVVVRVLGPWEAAPPEGSTLTLHDVETGQHRVLRITPSFRAGYLQRLDAISDALRDRCRALGTPLVDVVAEAPAIRTVLEQRFLPLGLVVPA